MKLPLDLPASNAAPTGSGRHRAKASFVVAAHLATVPVGGGAALIDGLIIGQPVCFTVLGLAYLAWSFWPSR